jgi:hypothetical protein
MVMKLPTAIITGFTFGLVSFPFSMALSNLGPSSSSGVNFGFSLVLSLLTLPFEFTIGLL